MYSEGYDARIVALAQGPLVTSETLSVWGGEVPAANLSAFLLAWDLPRKQMPWRIWETASEIEFRWETLPIHAKRLERGRLFGEGGDLALRRDGERFLWTFVGPAGVRPPAGFDDGDGNYWAAPDAEPLYERADSVLLWGSRVAPGVWLDDRVGRSELCYPRVDGEDRVWLDLRRYDAAGRTVFTWYRGLRGAQ